MKLKRSCLDGKVAAAVSLLVTRQLLKRPGTLSLSAERMTAGEHELCDIWTLEDLLGMRLAPTKC